MQQNLNRNVVFKHRSIAASLDDNRCFPIFIDEEASGNSMRKAVILDKMHHFYVCKDDLVTDLRKHVKGNIFALSSQYYHQQCGMCEMF